MTTANAMRRCPAATCWIAISDCYDATLTSELSTRAACDDACVSFSAVTMMMRRRMTAAANGRRADVVQDEEPEGE